MNIGIVGSSRSRFTDVTMNKAIVLIKKIIDNPMATTIISGHCPADGVDIWAEDYAKLVDKPTKIFTPEQNCWDGEYGYKARNIDIANNSDILHVITVKIDKHHEHNKAMAYCYHCNTDTHVRSGGCWTGEYAKKLGKKVIWHILGEKDE